MTSRRHWRLFGSRHGERRTGRRGSRPAERLRNERLEPRLALAADVAVTLVDGVLRIEGTSGDDAIFIRQEGEAVAIDYASGLNTFGRVAFPSGVERIEAQGGAGRDLFVLQLGSLADQVIVDTGPQADLLLSDTPVEVRNASGRDLFVPLVDQALPPGSELTSHRIDRPNLAHEAVYIGQSLTTSRSWTADGRLIEITVEGRERIIRSTSLGGHPILQEYWGDKGGYIRIVTGRDGTVLRETFQDGVLQLEERQRGEQLIRTTWDQDGYSFRQSRDGDRLFLEEAWDPQGGYRRAWVDEAGRAVEEVFEDGSLRIKTVTKGARQERGAWDAAGNRVREVLVRGTMVRLDEWSTDGIRRTTRYAAGLPVSRETFENDRLVQREAWADGRLVKTAWNETGDRIVQTFVGELKIREEEIRSSGERRVTEMADGLLIRTMTDTAGNVVEERLVPEPDPVLGSASVSGREPSGPLANQEAERLLAEAFDPMTQVRLVARRLQAADGSVVLTTFDPSGPAAETPVSEERISADGRQAQRTTWSPGQVLRLSLQDGLVIQRERWRPGSLRRIAADGSGTIRVEWFTGSDAATFGEGTRVSETITTASGDQRETIWDPDGTRRVTGRKNGVVLFEEQQRGSRLTSTFYGADGSRQDEVIEGQQRTVIQQMADGGYREQRFEFGDLRFELLRNNAGGFKETTWRPTGHYNADTEVTEVFADGPATNGSRNVRMRTTRDSGYKESLMWRGGGTAPGYQSTFLKQAEYTKNGLGWPLGPSDNRNELWFYDQGRLVYFHQILGNGTQVVLVNNRSDAWEQAKQGSYFGLSGGNVFSLTPGGESFNLGGGWVREVANWVENRATETRDGAGNAIGTAIDPLRQVVDQVAEIFTGIESITHAIDVNFRTIMGDIDAIVGSIDFGKFALPGLEAVRFEGIDFKPAIDFKWSPLDVKFATPIAAIDFGKIASGAWNDAKDYAADKAGVISDWLAKVDPFAWVARKLIVKEWDVEPSGFQTRLKLYMEAGYTRDQAILLYQLLDREKTGRRGLRGRYLEEFNEFLAAEGQKVYQSHLESDGGELDAAGHARLQQIAGQQAQARLLARYGLNPDGTKVAPVRDLDPWEFSLRGDDENDPRFSTDGDGSATHWEMEPIIITPSKPTKERPPRDDDSDFPEPEPPDSADEEEEARRQREEDERKRRVRIAETRQWIADEFPAAISEAVVAKVGIYAQGRGKVVTNFYDSVEQTMRIGGSFAAGLGTGATAAVEGLAKGIVAAFNADTWAGLGDAVRQQGRNFLRSDDRAKFIADFGEQTYRSFEDSVVQSISEWNQASPEGRARMLGELAGQVATDAVLGGVAGKIAGRLGDAAKLGRKTKAAVDKTTSAPEFAAYEAKVKAAAGRNRSNPEALLKAHDKVAGESFAKQLREQGGMTPAHAQRISQFVKDRKQMAIIRSSNSKSLQYHGRPGYAAKSGDLKLKTNRQTGLVTATKRRDGALIDARGEVVKGFKVDANGWIVNTDKLVNGKPTRTNYRLDRGHVVDAKGTKFYSDYDILSIDEEPLNGPGWQMVSTGDATTGPGQVIHDLNRAVTGNDRGRDMFKHGANRENYRKSDKGIYQIDTPEVGETFIVFDSDGRIFVADQLYVKRLLEGRNIPTDNVLPPLPGDGDWWE